MPGREMGLKTGKRHHVIDASLTHIVFSFSFSLYLSFSLFFLSLVSLLCLCLSVCLSVSLSLYPFPTLHIMALISECIPQPFPEYQNLCLMVGCVKGCVYLRILFEIRQPLSIIYALLSEAFKIYIW